MEENVTVPETPEVVKHTDAEWYQNVSLEDAEVFIRSNLQSAVRSVIATGFYLKHIRDNELYLEAGYKNINEYAMDRFGLSASATSRYITRNTRFSRGGNSPLIDDRFKDFSKSQLQEMLGMSDEQLEQVTPDMTVREIRSMARPKEVPYIEIPGQTELKDIPGVMPEERAESFEASTAELFDVEEDENMVQSVAGKPIIQEISITELVEEEDAEIATSQPARPQDSMTIRKFIKAWKEYQLDDFKRAMRAMRTGQNTGEKAKQIQKELAPHGCHYVGCSEYSFNFHSFAGGMDWQVRNEKIHLKYGRLASELLCMYDPWSSEFDEEPDIIDEQRNESIDAAEKQQMGHCLHRPEYECSLPEKYMHRPGSGTDCAHECCWECVKHGECKLECNSSGDVENFIELSANLIKLVAEYVKKCRWIPVEEKLPEDGTYLTTLNGELVGQKEPFTGMCGIENGKWDEEGCVIAWMPLPEPYREKEKPAAGVGWKGHYRGRFEKIE